MIRRLVNSLIFWLILGAALRLVFIFPQYSGDLGNHLAWGRGAVENLAAFYTRTFPGFNSPNYPPLAIYLFSASYSLYLAAVSIATLLNQILPVFPSAIVPFLESLNAQTGFIKILPLLADLGSAFFIYLLSRRFLKSSLPLLLTLLFLLNPAIIYVSTVWGQIEPLVVFFLLASLYFALTAKKNFWLSHLFFVFALLTKQTALWLLSVYLLLWWQQGVQFLITGLLLQLTVFLLSYQPLLSRPSLISPFTLYFSTLSGSSVFISDAAWNLWAFIFPGREVSDAVALGPLSVRIWSLLSLIVVYLSVTLQFFKKRTPSLAFSSLFLLSLAAFFLQTRVHERHLYPALVFLLLLPLKPIFKFPLYLIISVFFMANLYWSLGLPFI